MQSNCDRGVCDDTHTHTHTLCLQVADKVNKGWQKKKTKAQKADSRSSVDFSVSDSTF